MYSKFLLFFLLVFHAGLAQAQESTVIEPVWKEQTTNGTVVTLWFFWSEKCPHCLDAYPQVVKIPQQYPWVELKSYQLAGHAENVVIYQQLAGKLGEEARSVPAFIFCGEMHVGWDREGQVEQMLINRLNACRNGSLKIQEQIHNQRQDKKQDGTVAGSQQTVSLPLLGDINPQNWSLTVFTIVIAGMDSFNPCAFFVLMFLLSLLIHAGSKARMFVIGSFFIFISGLVYFTSMAAWLNLFGFIGHLTLVTSIAGLIAVVIALINIKDYFFFRQGASLSISDEHRGKLMQRMRGLLSATSLPTMLTATFTLAVIANLYELLCTAGFPMVYTRYLTLNNLSTTEHYLYILLYNLIYILPLLLIMLFFTLTFGQRKLQEHEGRILKLLSGLMMLALGIVLLVDPGLLNRIETALALLIGVIILTGLIVKLRST